jgi:hypothetical protein
MARLSFLAQEVNIIMATDNSHGRVEILIMGGLSWNRDTTNIEGCRVGAMFRHPCGASWADGKIFCLTNTGGNCILCVESPS